MAQPLNIRPPGLLEFFGIKAGEWGPRELSQQLVGVLDLWRMYVQDKGLDFDLTLTIPGPQQTAFTDIPLIGTAGPGPVVPNPVPPGELYYFDYCSIIAQQPASAGGQVSHLALTSTMAAAGYGMTLPFTSITPIASDGAFNRGTRASMLYPCFVQPGGTLSLAWGGNIVGAFNITVRVQGRLVRLRF